MQAYVITAPNKSEFRDVEMPKPGPHEALVRIELCVICNTTDRMIIDGSYPFAVQYPCVLGHETIGTVVETGDSVTSFRVGDRVTRAGFRAEQADAGLNAQWGGFAAYGIAEDIEAKRSSGLPHGYIKQAPQVIPPDIPLKDAALMISLGETSSFLRQLGEMADKEIVIIGTGIAGYAMTFFAKQFGARKVTTIGRRDERLRLAKALGADAVVNVAANGTGDDHPATGSADYLIDASGSSQAFMQSLRYLKNDGVIGLYGVSETAYLFPLNEAPARFRFDRAVPDETAIMHELVEMSRSGRLPIELLVTHEWAFSELDDAFEQVKRGEVVKGIVWLDESKRG